MCFYCVVCDAQGHPSHVLHTLCERSIDTSDRIASSNQKCGACPTATASLLCRTSYAPCSEHRPPDTRRLVT